MPSEETAVGSPPDSQAAIASRVAMRDAAGEGREGLAALAAQLGAMCGADPLDGDVGSRGGSGRSAAAERASADRLGVAEADVRAEPPAGRRARAAAGKARAAIRAGTNMCAFCEQAGNRGGVRGRRRVTAITHAHIACANRHKLRHELDLLQAN